MQQCCLSTVVVGELDKHIYIYIYTCVHIHIYIYIYIHTYTCVCVYIYIYIYRCLPIHITIIILYYCILFILRQVAAWLVNTSWYSNCAKNTDRSYAQLLLTIVSPWRSLSHTHTLTHTHSKVIHQDVPALYDTQIISDLQGAEAAAERAVFPA